MSGITALASTLDKDRLLEALPESYAGRLVAASVHVDLSHATYLYGGEEEPRPLTS